MLSPVSNNDLELILKWRNHPEVRAVMFTDREISLSEHLAWWEKMKGDPGRRVFIFLYRGQPVGVVNYFNINIDQRYSHWGFYLDNGRDWAPGEKLDAWLQLEEEVIQYAFGTLGCDTLLCETFAFNEQVLALHRKFGFKEVESFEREKNGQPLKVIVMALERVASKMAELDRQNITKDKPLRVAFLGSANWDIVSQDFIREYQFITGGAAELVSTPFGQYQTMLADVDSALHKENPDYCFY